MKKLCLTVCAFVWIFVSEPAPFCADMPAELVSALKQGRLLSYHVWTPDIDENVRLTCAVILSPGHPERDLSRLVIFRGNDLVLSFSPEQFPLSMFSISEANSNLVTVWLSGNGSYRLWVFSYSERKVNQVLQAGSKLMPEFVYPPASPGSLLVTKQELAHLPAGYWNQRIVISHLRWVLDPKSGARTFEPVTASVYVWDGKAYRVRKDVPWKDRFIQQ